MRRDRKDQPVEIQVRAPLAALSRSAQNSLADELLEAIPGFHGIHVDRLVRPFASQAQLPPDRDGPSAAIVSGGQDGIQLLEGDALQGVTLVDEKSDRVQEAEMPIGAARYRHA